MFADNFACSGGLPKKRESERAYEAFHAGGPMRGYAEAMVQGIGALLGDGGGREWRLPVRRHVPQGCEISE